MKLQHLAVIFIIIMLPITLILSQYIQTQIDMVNIRNNYSTSLLNATHDAMTAYELNSMNNNYSEDANSKKRDVQASINTFFNSLSNNLGVPGYIDKYVQPYIPAIVFTGYDGYYIYAKTTQTARYTYDDQFDINGNSTGNEEGDIKDGSTTPQYSLKPYIYYSAQYDNGISGNDNINVVINYTLDNYITVYGMVKGEYISKSGYLLKDEERSYIEDETLTENIICIRKTSDGDEYFEEKNCKYYYTYSPLNKTMQKIYYTDTDEMGYFYVTSAGYFSQVSNYKEIEDISELSDDNTTTTYILKKSIIVNNLYEQNLTDFTNDIINKLKDLTVNDMVVNDSGIRKRLGDPTLSPDNPYISLRSDTNILDNFDEHKRDVIKMSIQENLKSALANYANGETIYKLPIFTETDWDSIFSNISMIAFMQDLPISNGTYNSYAIATSTGNKEYVPDSGIYFIDNTNIYHRITCSKISGNSVIGYKAIEFERNKVKIDGEADAHNYYPHDATACYDCIVSSNYPSLYKEDGTLNVDDDILKKAYYTALARERVTSYKATQYLSTY